MQVQIFWLHFRCLGQAYIILQHCLLMWTPTEELTVALCFTLVTFVTGNAGSSCNTRQINVQVPIQVFKCLDVHTLFYSFAYSFAHQLKHHLRHCIFVWSHFRLVTQGQMATTDRSMGNQALTLCIQKRTALLTRWDTNVRTDCGMESSFGIFSDW